MHMYFCYIYIYIYIYAYIYVEILRQISNAIDQYLVSKHLESKYRPCSGRVLISLYVATSCVHIYGGSIETVQKGNRVKLS
jgi:hypothetical protein